MATQRLKMELHDIKKDPRTNFSVAPTGDDLHDWEGTMFGPVDSPYHGGLFAFTVKIPTDYPHSPPQIVFTTKIFHPNIGDDGRISLDILEKDKWSQVLSISKVLLSICSLLTDPNPKDPLRPDIAELYLSDRDKYDKTAEEWTKKYAQGGNS